MSGHNTGWSLQCYSLNASAAQLQQYLVRSGPAASTRSAWAAVWYTVVIQTLNDTAELRLRRVITHGAPETARSRQPDRSQALLCVDLYCKQQLTAMLPAYLDGRLATGRPACLCQHKHEMLAQPCHTLSLPLMALPDAV